MRFASNDCVADSCHFDMDKMYFRLLLSDDETLGTSAVSVTSTTTLGRRRRTTACPER